MKKTTFSILFGLSALIVLAGVVMKFMHLAGADILLASGFIVGSVIGFIHSLSQAKHIKKLKAQSEDDSPTTMTSKKLIINVIFVLSTLTVLVGAYMMIMDFSGAFIVLMAGFVVGSLISSIDNLQKKQDIEELETQLEDK